MIRPATILLAIATLTAASSQVAGIPSGTQLPSSHIGSPNYRAPVTPSYTPPSSSSRSTPSFSSSSSSSGSWSSGSGSGDGALAVYGTHIFGGNSDYDVDAKGFGFAVRGTYLGVCADFLFGSVTLGEKEFDSRSNVLVMCDLFATLPPLLALTEPPLDGLSLGVGPGFYAMQFTSDEGLWSSDDVGSLEDAGLTLSVFASYKLYIGEVGVRVRKFMGSDLDTLYQMTYGLAF